MTSLYHGISLKHPDKQIRLLSLQPRINDTDLHIFGTLKVYDFDDTCPPYTAISYVWGDEVPAFPIIINGQETRVGYNCWYALWQVLHHGITLMLWVDALCINQDDNSEKNPQVTMMGEIYSCAQEVAGCLGPGIAISQVQKSISNNQEISKELIRELDSMAYFQRLWD